MLLGREETIYFCTDSTIASASTSNSAALSAPMEEAMLSRSFRTVIFFSYSLMNFCIKSPDLLAQERFSMRAKVRFWRFSAFISIKKLCITG